VLQRDKLFPSLRVGLCMTVTSQNLGDCNLKSHHHDSLNFCVIYFFFVHKLYWKPLFLYDIIISLTIVIRWIKEYIRHNLHAAKRM
jgi:hypothetical protein